MKRIGTILIIFVTTFIFIPKVFATNYMTASKTDVKVGETFEIIVNFDKAKSWDIHVISTENASNCTIDEKDSTEDGENVSRNFHTICTATSEGKVTVALNGIIKLKSEEEDAEEITLPMNEEIEVNVAAVEEPIGLSSLQVTGGLLSPIFDSTNIENTGYTITLNSSEATTFKITAVAKTATDTISPKRESGSEYESINLDNITFITSGNNNTMLIEIDVGEGERLVKYRITVVKPHDEEIFPPELLTLTIGSQSIPLVSGLTEYSIELSEEDLDENGAYLINATLKDETNYMFSEFLTPPKVVSGKEFTLSIVPKDPSAGLSSVDYKITVKTSVIDPVITPTETTTKRNNNGQDENPQTGSTSALIVGIILIASLASSLYLYKKNINGYN